MQKVIRLTALGILTLAGLTACGDKITNVGSSTGGGITTVTTTQGTTSHGVSAVTVTPASVSITVGQSTALFANVTADSGVARTVTWTSQSTGVATVDANGNVKGVSAGTAVIVATSTADPSKQGTAAVTVAGLNNPSITISGLTNNLGQPATLNNIAGQLNVTLNVDPGSSIIQRIDLLMSCNGGPQIIVASQIVGSTVAGKVVAPSTWGLGLKTASTSGPKGVLANVSRSTPSTSTPSSPAPSAPSAAFGSTAAPVTLSFNTAALDSTGNPIFKNGQCTLTGKLTTTAGATFTSQNSVQITLNNVSGFAIASITSANTNGGTWPNSTINPANGLVYNQGNVTLKLTAVNYSSGAPLKTIQGSFLGRAFSASPAAGTQTFTIVFPNDSTQTAGFGVCTSNCLGIYQYYTQNNAAGEPGPSIGSSIDTLGNQGFNSGGPIVANTGFRIDNKSPFQPKDSTTTTTTRAPAVNANTGSNNWLNGTYTWLGNGKYVSGGDSAFATNTTVQIGYAPAAGYTALPTAGSTYTGTVTGTAYGNAYCSTTGFTIVSSSSGTTNIATSGTNNAYRVRAFEYDPLGNVRCTDLVVSNGGTQNGVSFGVDRSPPLLSFSSAGNGVAANSAVNTGGDGGKHFVFVYSDTGSGFVQATPVAASITFDYASDSLHCVYGWHSSASGSSCLDKATPGSIAVDSADGGSAQFTAPLADATNTAQGYYTVHVHAVDQAGNISGTDSTRTVLLDNTIPTAGALSQSPNPAVALGSVTETSAAADNVDLATWSGTLIHAPASGTVTFLEPGGTFHATFSGTLMQSGTATTTISNLARGMQGTSATGVIAADAAGPQASIVVTDAAGNNSAASTAAIVMSHAPNNVFTTESDSFFVNSSAGTVSKGATTPTSTNLTAVFKGSTVNNPNQPFATVYFYYKNAANQLVLIGSQTLASVTDINSPNSRSFTYTLSGVTAAQLGNATTTVYAVGYTSAGDAVVTNAAPAAVTIVN